MSPNTPTPSPLSGEVDERRFVARARALPNQRALFDKRKGFSAVELLLVLGIILLVMALLVPALGMARKQANSVKCQSNLRNLGIILMSYVNENRGWLFPVGPNGPDGRPSTFGTTYPPHERWPMRVPGLKVNLPDPLPYDPAEYDPHRYEPEFFPVSPFTSPILVCPTDDEPVEAHSYVLNQHLADKRITFGNRDFGGLKPSEVIIAGEKRMTERDYYMERRDFERIVEKYKHGAKAGSNYLYFDGHVDTAPPPRAMTGLDPWDFSLPEPATSSAN